MAHTPQHPDNPCNPKLPEAERVPAKIWELLRRNEKFQRAVAKLQCFDEIVKAERTIGPTWFAADSLVETLKHHHSFAGHALEWLVPEPLFRVSKVTLPKGVDLTGKSWVSLDTITEGRGITPELKDREHWTWKRLKPGQPRVGGEMMRRGPTIEWQTSAIPRFHWPLSPIAEWHEYHRRHGPFTIKDSWLNTPPHFKRVFCWLWRHADSRAKDSTTGHRYDAPCEHETKFFQGWSLLSAIGGHTIEHEGLARAFTFDDLAQNYRVFAFPNSIRSRMEARRMADWLVEQLCRLPDGKELPKHEPEIYGTPIQWDVFLFAGRCDDGTLFNSYKQAKPEVKPIERLQKWRKERLNYVEHFRAIEHEVARIFPVKMPAPQS